MPTPFVHADVGDGRARQPCRGPTRAAINYAGLDEMRQSFAAALELVVRPDGTVRLDNVFRVVIASA